MSLAISHSVTCYPTQVNIHRLNPIHIQAGTRFTYRTPERWKAELTYSWLDSAPAGSRTSDLSITSPTPNHCITKTTWVCYIICQILTSASKVVVYVPSGSAASTLKAATHVKVHLVQALTAMTGVQSDTPRILTLANVKVCVLAYLFSWFY